MDVLSASVFAREEGRLSGIVFAGAAKLLATRIPKGTCLATGQPRKFPRAKWVWLASLIGGRGAMDEFFGGESCEARVAEPEHAEPTITNYYRCVAVGGEA